MEVSVAGGWWALILDLLRDLVRTQLLGSLVGFVSAWVLFELTERRKRRQRQRAIRRALLAELETVEWVLSSMVAKYSVGTDDVKRGLSEWRWFTRQILEGRDPGFLAEELEQLKTVAKKGAQGILEMPDDHLAAIIKALPPRQESRAVSPRAAVVDAVLAAPGEGFTDREIQRIADIRWQLQLLADEAHWMGELLRMTFTVEDPTNHAIVVANHEASKRGYRFRAAVALDVVRGATRELRARS